ncbi:MAG TPA: tetratricopeptide repeat protein [Candidatus Angelobacter sp.]
MVRFTSFLRCQILLAFVFPVLAQQVSPTEPNSSVRVPPPSENATAPELEKQGDDLRAQKAYLDSVDYYRAAIKKGDSAPLHNKTGICFLQLQRGGEARKEFKRAIQMDKAYAEPHNNLGALDYNGGHYGQAVSEYRKALQLNDGNASFHSNLGTAYFAEKDWAHAIKEYSRARALDPTIFDRQSSGGVSIRLVSSTDLGHFHYMMAQIAGSQNDLDRCRSYLSKANEEGYPIRDALRDDQFAGLRKDPNFVAFVRSLKPPQTADQ